MGNYRHQAFYCYCGLALLTMLFCLSCDSHSPQPPETSKTGQLFKFNGTWTTTGNRQTLSLGPDHHAAVFRYTGSLLLSGEQRLKAGFKAEVIGFTDSKSGLQGRCVWTDEHGESIFSEISAPTILPDQKIEGSFFGGTGRYTGITGQYTFKWLRLIDAEDGEVSGRVVDLAGWARLASPGDQASQGDHR
jgi:hypothetical protein